MKFEYWYSDADEQWLIADETGELFARFSSDIMPAIIASFEPGTLVHNTRKCDAVLASNMEREVENDNAKHRIRRR